MKKNLPRVGFEPVMPRVGRDLKQWLKKWNVSALPLSYQVTNEKIGFRHQKECF